MDNGNMPAMPSDVKAVYEAMTDSTNSWGKAALGITKREMMAMHAPEIPDWFDSQWRKEYEGNEMYFKEEVDEWDCSYLQITKRGVKTMYFAWRAHYADELLAELERACHKT